MNATHWKQVKSTNPAIPYMMIPCVPNDPQAVQINMMHLEPDTVFLPDIAEATFTEAINNIKPSVSKSDLKSYETFTAMYGTQDARENTAQLFDEHPIQLPSVPTNGSRNTKPSVSVKKENEQKRGGDENSRPKVITLL